MHILCGEGLLLAMGDSAVATFSSLEMFDET